MPTEFVRYKGEKYWLQNSGYFQRDRKPSLGKIERLLHRVVWSERNGSIPDECVIHHKNENKRDNRIENLEPMDSFDHQSSHMKKRWLTRSHKKRFTIGLERAREAAKEWHKSDEGREWHRHHAVEVWENMKQYEMECAQCGKKYMAFRRDISKFCSNVCSMRSRPQKLIARKCCVCKKEFMSSKYKDSKHCSPTCSNKTMWKTRTPLKQGPKGGFLKSK